MFSLAHAGALPAGGDVATPDGSPHLASLAQRRLGLAMLVLMSLACLAVILFFARTKFEAVLAAAFLLDVAVATIRYRQPRL